jgi:hypothetical protein
MKTLPATKATDEACFRLGGAAHELVPTRAPEGHSGKPAIFAFSTRTDKADFCVLIPIVVRECEPAFLLTGGTKVADRH